MDNEGLAAAGIEPLAAPDLARWHTINERIRNPEGDVTIAIVGKYTGMKDAYKSLTEALSHGGIANKVKVNLDWIESEVFENWDPAPFPEHGHGILAPGGLRPRARGVAALAAALRRGVEGGGQPARLARYTANCEALVSGMAGLGFDPFLDPAIQAPIILTFHAPADPRYEFKAFYEAVVNHRPSPVPWTETIKVIGILEAVYASQVRGREIVLK